MFAREGADQQRVQVNALAEHPRVVRQQVVVEYHVEEATHELRQSDGPIIRYYGRRSADFYLGLLFSFATGFTHRRDILEIREISPSYF
jgi:hypothetical protein